MRQALKEKLFTALLGDLTPVENDPTIKNCLEDVVLQDMKVIESVLDADRPLLGELLAELLPRATCEETTGMVGNQYLRCGQPAIAVVKTRDTNPYFMCRSCAYHNVRNRGGIFIFSLDEEIKKVLVRC